MIFIMTSILIPIKDTLASSFLTPQDILKIPFTPAKYRFNYGEDSRQFGDLRIPESNGPYPVLVVIHGGCWTSKMANIDFMSSFAQAFTEAGIATWNIEYNCIDNKSGGWPGTFLDVGKAVDYLKVLSPQYKLDLTKVVVIGHSAGGHLALWTGARHKITENSDLYQHDPLKLKAVVNIAGPGDLNLFQNLEEKACMSKVINLLIGNMQEHFLQCSPYELLPINTKQILITGEYDLAAPVESMHHYMNKAKDLGDYIEVVVIKNAAHFEVVDHRTEAWEIIKDTVIELL